MVRHMYSWASYFYHQCQVSITNACRRKEKKERKSKRRDIMKGQRKKKREREIRGKIMEEKKMEKEKGCVNIT